jgi:2-dehydropantoate 2-reductase
VARRDTVNAVKANGLKISGPRGSFSVKLEAEERLSRPAQLVILATKTQDLATAIKDNLGRLQGSLILTTQNGIQADLIAARLLGEEQVISSIVMFGATSLKPAEIVHNFEGKWLLGRLSGAKGNVCGEVVSELAKAFDLVWSEDIKGMKYLKVFVNANNCIPAVLGLSMQEAFSDINIAKLGMAVWKEGLEIVSASGVKLTSLPDFPLERLIKLTSLSTEQAAGIYSSIMQNLSREPLYGSILQSIKRGRPSEIDYINGEFIALAEKSGSGAPLNKKLVDLVHQVERGARFYTKEELLNAIDGLVN